MDDFDTLQRLATAIAIGAVVGVERHWRERDEPDGRRTAGLRTFTLIGMAGGVAGLLARSLGTAPTAAAIVLVGFFCVVSAVFALYQQREAAAQNTFSVTTTVAAMLTFALGALAVSGDLLAASAGGVVLVSILASREVLHGFVRRLSWPELRSAIVLLGMSFVVLPLLPEAPIGPFGGISPAKTWLLVVLLAALSFCGYVAVRLFGNTRGELVAGAIGGLVSSTAATVTNARRAKDGGPARTLAAGALGACAVSYGRTAVLVATLAAPLSAAMIPALATAAAAMLVAAFLLARGGGGDEQRPEPTAKNPFDLDAVLTMAALLVGIAFLARAAAAYFGSSGLIAVSALSGLADVDAPVVTVAGMLPTLEPRVAAVAIGAAVVTNTLAKAGYALVLGSAAFGLRFAAATVVALAVGAATYAAGLAM